MKDKSIQNIEKEFEFNYDDGILLEHNKETYEKIVGGFNDGNKVLFEQATGTGKTYLALKYLHDFGEGKKVLFVSPSDVIKNYFVETYKEVLGKDFDCELKTCLYQGLNGIKDKQYDIIIFDEAHRMGAPVWGLNAKTLMSANPNAKVLGMTATLDRTDGVDVKQYFDNEEPVSQVTLVDALQNGILPNPDYTIAKVDFEDDNKYINNTVAELKAMLLTATKTESKEINEYLDKLKQAKELISKHKSIPQVFEQELNTPDLKRGKFIVFCPIGDSEEDTAVTLSKMEEMIIQAPTWFSLILGGQTPNIYKMHNSLGSKENEKARLAFQEDNSDNIKLLFAINMLNEGLHVGDIDGVIMLRNTSSRIIYLQQLGRTLSVGNNKKQPKVFDFVANLTTAGIDDINQIATTVNTGHGGSGKIQGPYNYKFKINIENLNALEFIDGLRKNIYNFEHRNNFVFSDFYRRLEEFVAKEGHAIVSTSYVDEKDGYKLGEKVSDIRRGHIKLKDEEKQRLEEMGFVWNVKELDRKELFDHLEKYYKEKRNLLIPLSYEVKDKDGKTIYKLGERISKIRSGRIKLKDEEKQRLEEMGFAWNAREAKIKTQTTFKPQENLGEGLKNLDPKSSGQKVKVQIAENNNNDDLYEQMLEETDTASNVKSSSFKKD